MAVSYVILNEGSGRGELRDQGSSATICYLINWEDLVSFTTTLMGGWQLTGTSVTRVRGLKHPDWPFYCNAVSFEPVGSPVALGGETTPHRWEYAKVTATFAPLNETDTSSGDGSDGVSEELNFSAKTITIPVGGAVDSNGDVVGQPTAKILPLCDYRVTLNGVPQLPGGNAALIFSLLGKVNDDTFRGAETGKMMFQGAKAYRTASNFSSLNSQSWKIDLSYSFNNLGWNMLYNSRGVLVEVTLKDGSPLYPSADLDSLLPGTGI